MQLLTVYVAEQMPHFISPACTRVPVITLIHVYVYYAYARYLSALVHAAVVSMFVTACGRDDAASNISQHLLQQVNISLCDRREYQITCVTAGRVALETMGMMMSQRHVTVYIVTARSTIQLWPVF